jgi:hypothetical protein
MHQGKSDQSDLLDFEGLGLLIPGKVFREEITRRFITVMFLLGAVSGLGYLIR